MADIIIRRAERGDVPTLLEIYNHYVTTTTITFDIEPRTLAQRYEWFEGFSDKGRFQCFVAVGGGRVIGWASSAKYKERAAYDTSIETSVYLTPDFHGKGLGRRLYQALFDALKGEDIHRVYGGITQPNEASVGLHKAMGFHLVGTYREVGRKFGHFHDVAVYERDFP